MSATNWDKELKFIEQEFDGVKLAPSLDSARRAAERHARDQKRDQKALRNQLYWAYGRLVLLAALAVGLYFWPYARTCGVGLYGYMAATALITVGAFWVVAATWRLRLALGHGAALVLVLASLLVLGAQVAPRVGYAKVDAANPPGWACK